MSADRMSAESEQLDELLNAFLDGELSREDAARVEMDLASDKKLQDRLESIQGTSNQLRNYFAAAKSSNREVDFVRGFMEAATESAVDGTQSAVEVASKEKNSWRQVAVAWGLVAASILAVSFLPRGGTQPSQEPNLLVQEESVIPTEVEPQLSTEPGAVTVKQYVSEMTFPAIMYLLEVDIEATDDALKTGVLQDIFQKHGIPIDKPLVVNDEIREVIEKSRMRVKPQGDKEGDEQALLYVVRAPLNSLGNALDEVYGNEVAFPVVKFALGFDTPNVSLFKTLIRNSGDMFAIDQAFTAPIASPERPKVASPFRGVGSEGVMVSSEVRRSGFSGKQVPAMSVGGQGSLENVLLFVRPASLEGL
jgi:negative regulator of sigma E activity